MRFDQIVSNIRIGDQPAAAVGERPQAEQGRRDAHAGRRGARPPPKVKYIKLAPATASSAIMARKIRLVMASAA
jgi:hypothetical protein